MKVNILLDNFWKKARVLLLLTAFSLPNFVFSAETPCDPSQKICNPINVSSLVEFVRIILEGVVKIGMPIVALALVYSGFLFVFARGKPEDLTKAKNALIASLIGAALILGSWAIAQIISETVLDL